MSLTCIALFFQLKGIAFICGFFVLIIPDFRRIISLAMGFMLFITPIIYLPSQLGKIKFITFLNPFSYSISCFKHSLTGNQDFLIFSIKDDYLLLLLISIFSYLIYLILLKVLKKTNWTDRYV